MTTRAEGPIPTDSALASVVWSLTVWILIGVPPMPSFRSSSRSCAASFVSWGLRVPIVMKYGSTSTSTKATRVKRIPAGSHHERSKRPASRSRIVSTIVRPTTWPSRPGHWSRSQLT